MAATLGCRLVLNLRRSLLCSMYNDEVTTVELDTLIFKSRQGDPKMTPKLMEHQEQP